MFVKSIYYLNENNSLPEADPVLPQEVHQPLLVGVAHEAGVQHALVHDGDRHEAVVVRLRLHPRLALCVLSSLGLGSIRGPRKLLDNIPTVNLVAVADQLSPQ